VGRLISRVGRLENLARERAADELRRAWGALADEELAALCTGWHRDPPDRSQRERRVVEKLASAVPDATIATAIALTDRMDSEEVERLLKELVGRFGIPERRAGVRCRLQAMSGGEA
jgi:hypothetical protein